MRNIACFKILFDVFCLVKSSNQLIIYRDLFILSELFSRFFFFFSNCYFELWLIGSCGFGLHRKRARLQLI